jgi:activator of HSP90 ATPase
MATCIALPLRDQEIPPALVYLEAPDLRGEHNMPKTIRQSVTFPATPSDVYDALMTSRLHSKIIGGKAVISPKVGGRFSAYDGYCTGVNIELKPGKGGTRMTFTHTGVPDEQYESIKQGWIDFYWLPMKALFGKGARK